jgi:hypothetical protein
MRGWKKKEPARIIMFDYPMYSSFSYLFSSSHYSDVADFPVSVPADIEVAVLSGGVALGVVAVALEGVALAEADSVAAEAVLGVVVLPGVGRLTCNPKFIYYENKSI